MDRKSITVAPLENEEGIRLSMRTTSEDANINGALHGGIQYWLCDETVGAYVNSCGKTGAASEGSIHYYRPGVPGELLTCVLHVRKTGHRPGIYFTELFNEANVLIADAIFTVVFRT